MAKHRSARLALPKHVHMTRMRGREYFSFWPYRGTSRAGTRVSLPGLPTLANGMPNPEWWANYESAANAADLHDRQRGLREGTVAASVAGYQMSPEWHQLKPRVKTEWSRHLSRLVKTWGDLSIAGIEPKHVARLRDSRSKTPADSNNLMRATSALFRWSVLHGLRLSNPCREVPRLKIGEGYPPWPVEEIEHFRDHARRDLWEAAALALYTGQRQGDVLAMKWSDIEGNVIKVKQSKTKKHLSIPIHYVLKLLLEDIRERQRLASPTVIDLRDAQTILTNTRGEPWGTGFKASWQAEFKKSVIAPLRAQKLVFHGLRKSAVVCLLEAGCTTAEVQAITGQSIQMVEHYGKQVNQEKLALSGMSRWEAASPERRGNST